MEGISGAPPSTDTSEKQKELRAEMLAIQKLDISPEEKAKRMQALMTRNSMQPTVELGADPDEMCRYCMSKGSEALISPCSCKGGQEYCHLSCLHQWQRKVLITQSPNPRFHTDDSRHEVCNVCTRCCRAVIKTKCSTRIPFLLLPTLISTRPVGSPFSIEPPSRKDLMRGLTGPELVDLCEVGCLIVSAESHTARIGMALAAFQGREVEQMRNWFQGVYLIITSSDGGEDGNGSVHAFNLNRPVETLGEEEAWPAQLRAGVAKTTAMLAPTGVTVCHFLGGPCAPDMPVALTVLECPEGEEPDFPGAVVLREGCSCAVIGGLDTMAALSAAQQENPVDPYWKARVHLYWGLAGWTKTQLLGELARGSWGMCKGTIPEIEPLGAEAEAAAGLWEVIHAADRLHFAPNNEMQDPNWGREESLETH